MNGQSRQLDLFSCQPQEIFNAPSTNTIKLVSRFDLQLADKFLALAEAMTPDITNKLYPATALQRLTPRRARETDRMQKEGEHLANIQGCLYGMAEAYTSGNFPNSLRFIKNRAQVSDIYYKVLSDRLGLSTKSELLKIHETMMSLCQRQGIKVELVTQIRIKQRNLAFAGIPDYFPTPDPLCDRIIKAAKLEPGMTVLEPHGGGGHLCDAIAAVGCQVETVEYDTLCREVLEMKGYPIVGRDFLEFTGQYSRICANPPFSGKADSEHIWYGYEHCLSPGGIFVSLMSPSVFYGSTNWDTEWVEWFEDIGGKKYELPEGSFQSSDRPTQVQSLLVVLEKGNV